jgi:thiamine biosynthesis lipoprotein
MCRVKLYTPHRDKAEACFLEIKKNTLLLEKKYNFYNKNSYLTQKINQRRGNKVSIDNETYEVLKTVHELSLETKGVFDISVGTLKECYQLDSLIRVQACLEEKKRYTGADSWYLQDKKLRFKDKKTLLDLGGVIKEYAVDEAVKIVRKHNINSAIINFGGDLYCVGKSPENRPFSIAIKNPLDKTKNLLSIQLENQALTTSANYERNIKIEDEEFSHIVSNKSKNSEILSATIVSNSVLTSGIYSTAFMIHADIDIPEGLKVLLIDRELRVHQNMRG